MKKLTIVSVAVAANIVLIFVGAMDFDLQLMLIVLGIASIAVPLGFVSAVLFLIAEAYFYPRLGRLAKWGFLIALVILSALPSLAVTSVIVGRQVEETKRYCENLVPELDRWKVQHGTYPTQLSDLGHTTDLPRLLRAKDYSSYSDGQSFSFRFFDPRKGALFYTFNSVDRQWGELDWSSDGEGVD